jgi:hypothetical protein
MAAVLDGRDSLLVLPTGGGKSLCFQVPALVRDGLALVISPLIALMKDQVDTLVANGIGAACYNSSMSADQRTAVRAGLREAVSLSFASASDLDLMGHGDPVPVANPPSADQPFLRTSLVPNLLRAIARTLHAAWPRQLQLRSATALRLRRLAQKETRGQRNPEK